jgi:Fe-S oxidoreductase/nitrate reductase gamma subunit
VTTTTAPEHSTVTASRRWARRLKELLLHAVVQDRVLQRWYPGVMHFLIFWGMVIQILGTGVNLLQQDLFLPVELTTFPRNAAYLGFELVMDLAGGMIILGVLMAALRRLVLRPSYLQSRWDDWYSLGLLLLIALLGFAAESVRILAVEPPWRSWSPIGNLIASGLTAVGLTGTAVSPSHAILFWAHAITGMVFVASLPFTKLRHVFTGPLNIVFKPERHEGALEPIRDLETAETLGAGEIEAFQSTSLLAFDACVQCGRCEDVCPATLSGMPYSPRSIIRSLHDIMHTRLISGGNGATPALLGDAIQKETPWLCTTCGACTAVCPMFVNPVSSAVEMRRHLTLMTGEVPGSVGEALTNMERRGNPWGLPKENHAPWVKELGVRILQPGETTENLLFIGCAFGYDSRLHKAGGDLVRLLQAADMDFAVLGANEGCCGETARRLGHEYIFQVMVEENIAAFDSVRFERIITPCAHCFNTLKNEYPQFGGQYEVLHHTEFLTQLSSEGRLKFSSDAGNKTYTFHDSCYLGRYNGIFEGPRETLDAIPNLQRTEMPRRKANAFCCGGGGGHMWMEIDPNTRINHRRLDEAVKEARADVVVTACPYCLIMFDDAIRSKGIGEQVAVRDLAEVLSESSNTDGAS